MDNQSSQKPPGTQKPPVQLSTSKKRRVQSDDHTENARVFAAPSAYSNVANAPAFAMGFHPYPSNGMMPFSQQMMGLMHQQHHPHQHQHQSYTPVSHAAFASSAGANAAPHITQQSSTMTSANTSTSIPSTSSTLSESPNIELEHSSSPKHDINLSDDAIEAAALIDIGLDAKTVYNDTIRDHNSDHMLKKLLAMGTGQLSDTETHNDRIQDFVDKKWISQSEAKVTNGLLKLEILRRFDIDKEFTEETLKKPSTSGNATALTNKLSEHPLYNCDKKWITKKIGSVLDSIQAAQEEESILKMRQGEHMRNETILRIRLTHGKSIMFRFCSLFNLAIQLTKYYSTLKQLYSGIVAETNSSRSLILFAGRQSTVAIPRIEKTTSTKRLRTITMTKLGTQLRSSSLRYMSSSARRWIYRWPIMPRY